MPRAISALIAPSMNAPAVVNGPLVIHNTTVSGITAPTVDALPIWPVTAPIAAAPSVTPLITFSSIVLLRRIRARASFSMTETLRGFDVVPVVQVLDGGIVMVRGHGLIFSVVHLPPLTVVKDARPTLTYSFLPASWVGNTHEETDFLPISDREERG